jgi:hypothetical protein
MRDRLLWSLLISVTLVAVVFDLAVDVPTRFQNNVLCLIVLVAGALGAISSVMLWRNIATGRRLLVSLLFLSCTGAAVSALSRVIAGLSR